MNQSRQAQREYVQAVLDLYVALPATRHAPGRQDRRLAAALYERGIPLGLVRAALLLAAARRTLRGDDAQPLPQVGCLHYFLPVIDELRNSPARPQIRRLPLLQARALHETQARSDLDRWSENFTFNWSVTPAGHELRQLQGRRHPVVPRAAHPQRGARDSLLPWSPPRLRGAAGDHRQRRRAPPGSLPSERHRLSGPVSGLRNSDRGSFSAGRTRERALVPRAADRAQAAHAIGGSPGLRTRCGESIHRAGSIRRVARTHDRCLGYLAHRVRRLRGSPKESSGRNPRAW